MSKLSTADQMRDGLDLCRSREDLKIEIATQVRVALLFMESGRTEAARQFLHDLLEALEAPPI
jgi:hypothetical protein